jgi:glucosylceramidase
VGHLSSVVKPGAVSIGTSGFSDSGFHHAAFENNDDTYAVVLLNITAAGRVITLDDGTIHFACEVSAKSVITYRWKNNTKAYRHTSKCRW